MINPRLLLLCFFACAGLGRAQPPAASPTPAPDLAKNSPPRVAPLNPALPTIFIAGDSTAARGRGESQQGWGVPFADYFDSEKVNVANRGRSGASTRTYMRDGNWERILGDLKAGDIVLIQYGHNDGSPVNEDPSIPRAQMRSRGTIPGIGEEMQEIDNVLTGQHEVVHTFGWYLRKMIADTKAKGASPVVLSPTVRNLWTDDRIERGPGRYGPWSYDVAKAAKVPFIDISSVMADKFQALGPEKTKAIYQQDHTHFNAVGADMHAAAVVAGLKGVRGNLVAKLLSAKGEAIAADRTMGLRLPAPSNPALPSLFLAGDSTVRNGVDDGGGGQWGWGDFVVPYFDSEKINVVNRAVGGTGVETFKTIGHWEHLMSMVKPGDFVMIQFGHNDNGPRGPLKGIGEETEERADTKSQEKRTLHTWGWYLRQDIAEVRAKGATPIVCSLVPRKIWKDGKVTRNKDAHAGWAEQIAAAEHAPFVDLNETIAKRYDEIGHDATMALFPAPATAADGKVTDEHTHTNLEGAKFSAGVVVATLKALPTNPLAPYLRTDAH